MTPPPSPGAGGGPWSPLGNRRFAVLWGIWLAANICAWMAEVAAAWLMTSLTDSALMVSLVQTAVTLPVFLLALPSGALADLINRRSSLVVSQAWLAAVAGLLTAQLLTQTLTPVSLLALMFAAGMATAVRWPVFNAVVPEVVSSDHLAAALTLHAMAINAARLVGPLIAGVVVAIWGGSGVFGLVCALSLVSAALLARWPYVPPVRTGPRPALGRAVIEGLRHVLRDRRMRLVILQSGVVYMSVASLLGMLPLVAQALRPGDAGLYASLAASAAFGAICIGPFLHAARRNFSGQALITGGMLVFSAGVLGVSLARQPVLAGGLLFIAGAGWLAAGNTLSVTLQRALSNDYRARGMSVFLMAMMAGGAIGSATFGALADGIGLHGALAVMAAVLALLALTFYRWVTRLPLSD